MPLPSIGFIGLGLMGKPMSQRLLQAGYHVTVWNRDPSKTEPLNNAGAHVATSIAELSKQSDIIMLCVTDTSAVEAIVFGSGGISDSCRATDGNAKLLVDFSSIEPEATKAMAERLQHDCAIDWIDAPVSGGVIGAESGSLVIMAGGPEDIINSLRPVLSPLSQRVTRMGAVGSGQATKVCNQMIVSCNVLVIAEVLALAEKSGVDACKLPEALKGGFADSIPLQITGSRMAERDFESVKWHIKTLLKDLNMSQLLAGELNANTPMAKLATELMTQHSDSGLADKDPATLIQAYTSKM